MCTDRRSRRDQGKAREVGAGSGASRLYASTSASVAIAEELGVGCTYMLGGCVANKLLVIGSHFADDFRGCLRGAVSISDSFGLA